MWDLVLTEALVEHSEIENRGLRVLDIAAGSGGFLVAGLARLRERYEAQRNRGSMLSAQEWLNRAADGFNGVEIQRFSAFLAELNLLLQFSGCLQLILGSYCQSWALSRRTRFLSTTSQHSAKSRH
jgi:hypothetical protein